MPLSTVPPIWVGQTLRATASDLVDAAGVTLVAPTVTIDLKHPDGTVDSGTVVHVGSTWYAEFAPLIDGEYVVKAAATSGGGTWKDETRVYVSPEL